MAKHIVNVDVRSGFTCPEGQVERIAAFMVDQLNAGKDTITIGNYELVNEIRLAVKRGQLSDVAFMFEEQLVPIMPDGQLMLFPNRFPGSRIDAQLSELLV